MRLRWEVVLRCSTERKHILTVNVVTVIRYHFLTAFGHIADEVTAFASVYAFPHSLAAHNVVVRNNHRDTGDIANGYSALRGPAYSVTGDL